MIIRRPADPEGVAEAARRIREDGVVVIPTETFYGLACDPRRPVAVERIFALKGRPAHRALPLVAGARDQVVLAAPGWEQLTGACALAEAFWPGALALLCGAAPGFAPGVAAADGTVAIRWTSHPVAAAVAMAIGFPLVATSANRTGAPPRRTAEGAIRGLAAPDFDVLVLDDGRTPGGRASTIVDLRPGRVVVVRKGAVAENRIRAALARAVGANK